MTAATLQARPKVYRDQIASAVPPRAACMFCGLETVRRPGEPVERVLCGWDSQTFTFNAAGELVTWAEEEGMVGCEEWDGED